MPLPAPLVIAAALVVKGRWAYHFISNRFSVREANRAAGADIDKLHDVGDELVAAIKVLWLLDASVKPIDEVAKVLATTIRLIDRLPRSQRDRIDRMIGLSKRMDEEAVNAIAFTVARLFSLKNSKPAETIESLYLGLHLAGCAGIQIVGKDLEPVVKRLIAAHKKRRLVSDKRASEALSALGTVDVDDLAHALRGIPAFKRVGIEHPRLIAGVLLGQVEESDRTQSIARLVAERYST